MKINDILKKENIGKVYKITNTVHAGKRCGLQVYRAFERYLTALITI